MIDEKQLKKFLPRNKQTSLWTTHLNNILPKYEINTNLRVAGFLSQCAHESNQFTVLQENLNYSKTALRRTFKKYFTVKQAAQYARQPERIANRVYANRMDNGPESSGDGWKFRGHGIIQLTGRYNITQFGKSIGKNADEALAYLKTEKGALEGACWFWQTNNLNKFADEGDVKRMTKKINGGYNGLKDRQKFYDKALKIFTNLDRVTLPSQEKKRISTVTFGSKGLKVKRIQQFLIDQNFNIVADGDYGRRTLTAVRVYQKTHGLHADGIVGKNTWKSMFGKTVNTIDPVIVNIPEEATADPINLLPDHMDPYNKPEKKTMKILNKPDWRKKFLKDDS
jgi:putative chitinase